jgi:hypothetical protein
LIQAYPMAAGQADEQGDYPLQLAAMAGYTRKLGLEALRQTAPNFLHEQERPAVKANAAVLAKSESPLDTTYHLQGRMSVLA